MAISESDNALVEAINNTHLSREIAPDRSDWEYEYDETDTDDYYFTLDLTTHQPEAVTKANPKSTGKASKGGNIRNVKSNGLDDFRNSGLNTSRSEAFGAEGELQLRRLHSANPLIKLDNILYSCAWSTDLGTQFYIARPGVAEQPLRSGRVLDVVGISQARLTGRPAFLRKRKQTVNGDLAGSSIADAITIDDDNVDIVVDTPNNVLLDGAHTVTKSMAQFAAAREKTTDPAMKAQASFLERFAAIKRRKGEKDIIPLHGVKDYRVRDTSNEVSQFGPARRSASESVNESYPVEGVDGARTEATSSSFPRGNSEVLPRDLASN